jgi:hypothetical protein
MVVNLYLYLDLMEYEINNNNNNNNNNNGHSAVNLEPPTYILYILQVKTSLCSVHISTI